MNRKQRRAREKQAGTSQRFIAEKLREAAMLAASGKRQEAERLYRAILTRDPANQLALRNSGLLAEKREDYVAAEKFYTRLLHHAPDNPEAILSLAFVKMDLGEYDAAIKMVRDIDTDRLNANMTERCGILFREAGDFETAQKYYRLAIEKDPDCITAYHSLRVFKKYSADDPLFRQARDLWQNAGRMNRDDRVYLGITLGKMYLDHGDDENAFVCFEKANALDKPRYKQSIDMWERYIDTIIDIFDDEFVKNAQPNRKPPKQTPVFIVGMPRSGSTLLDQILNAHPDAASIGEAMCMPHSIPVYTNPIEELNRPGEPNITRELLDDLNPGMAGRIAKEYITRARRRLLKAHREHSPFIVDKMLFNTLNIGVIRLALPHAKIIHTRRNPIDIGLSIWTLRLKGMAWSCDLEDIGRYYRAQEKLMDHWKTLYPGAIHTARYEDMVANPEEETRKLLARCGLDWHDDCLKFYESKRQVKTASANQVRKPVYTSSAGRSEKYRKYLEPLARIVEQGD